MGVIDPFNGVEADKTAVLYAISLNLHAVDGGVYEIVSWMVWYEPKCFVCVEFDCLVMNGRTPCYLGPGGLKPDEISRAIRFQPLLTADNGRVFATIEWCPKVKKGGAIHVYGKLICG